MNITYDASINDLTSFLKIIEKYINEKGNKLFFRGESKIYGDLKNNTNLIPKLFRPIRRELKDGKFKININEYNTIESYYNGSKEFYRELEQKDDRIENNFMAFCQHYGIPTPLLDVTSNPLVSLYFACISNKEDDGIVFIFDKNRLLKLPSDYLRYDKESPYNLYVLGKWKKFRDTIAEYFNIHIHLNDYHFERIVNTTIKEIREYYSNNLYKDSNEIEYLLKNLTSFDKLREDIKTSVYSKSDSLIKSSYINFLKTIGDMDVNHYNVSDEGIDGLFLFNNANIYTFLVLKSRDSIISGYKYYPSVLNFYVETSSNWDRIKTQGGSFIVECPTLRLTNNAINVYRSIKTDSPYTNFLPENEKVVENIPESYKIKISNKNKILNQLEILGINSKNLFKDLDHISKYIKEKYF